MSEHREFKDIRGSGGARAPGLSVDEFMASLEALQAEVATEKNLVWERVADGTLNRILKFTTDGELLDHFGAYGKVASLGGGSGFDLVLVEDADAVVQQQPNLRHADTNQFVVDFSTHLIGPARTANALEQPRAGPACVDI